LIASSVAMTTLLEAADRAAVSEGKVLITGESGVGKDLIARRIHALSRRSSHPLIPVNCAGLPESFARVGAVRTREGQLHRRLSRQSLESSRARTAAPFSWTKSAR
jgi:transcriptional regulator with GAF, ATPase, and Fis domain